MNLALAPNGVAPFEANSVADSVPGSEVAPGVLLPRFLLPRCFVRLGISFRLLGPATWRNTSQAAISIPAAAVRVEAHLGTHPPLGHRVATASLKKTVCTRNVAALYNPHEPEQHGWNV